ncbi:MAG: NTPase [Caulobacteraceae bacterium]|nr:NTPase [Caulobacteraceae bacterium]
MTEKANPSLHYDSAQVLPEHDQFGFRDLADRLTENTLSLLAAGRGAGSFVLGLEGRWGSGKSTILNYLRIGLKAALQADRQFLIDFDPWWLEEDKDIIAALLGAVVDALPRTEAGKAATALGKLVSAAGGLPEGIEAALKLSKRTEAIGEVLGAARQAGGDLGKLLTAAKPVRKLRDEVATAFAEKGFQFVVLIDDLDRLAPEKAIRVMNAIKSVADLPGFVYVLAYDPLALGNILQSYRPPLGADYFEKIVNVSVTVPPVTYSQMAAFIAGLLRPELRDPLAASTAHQKALVAMLEAPRDAIRLANAANFWGGTKISELHPPDFLLLEAIRLSRPTAYEGIRRTSDIWLHGEGMNAISRLFDTDAEKVEEHRVDVRKIQAAIGSDGGARDSAIRGALSVLFPKASGYLGEAAGFETRFEEAAKDPRSISQAGHFFTYFLHRPLPGSPTRAEIDRLVDPRANLPERRDLIAEIARRPSADVAPLTQLIALLDGEREYGRIDKATLFEVVLALITAPTGGADRSGNFLSVRRFAGRALSSIGELSDQQVLTLTGPGIDVDMAAAMHLIVAAGTGHYLLKDPGRERMVQTTDAVLDEAAQVVVDRILAAIDTDALFDLEILPHLLFMAFTRNAEKLGVALAPLLADDRRTVGLMDSYRGYTSPFVGLAGLVGITPQEARDRANTAYDALGVPEGERVKADWELDD